MQVKNWPAVVSILLLTHQASLFCAELSPEQRALHVLNRLANGPSPGELEHVSAIGVDGYIEEQLNPERHSISQSVTERFEKFAWPKQLSGDLIAEFRNAKRVEQSPDPTALQARRQLVQKILQETAAARLERALESPHQLEEVMTDFWFNHFNVFVGKGLDRVLIANYEQQAIRPYVLGRFRDLLGATAHHAAMLFYLDNWQSTAPGAKGPRPFLKTMQADGLNENYSREVMELHTLGADGGYTQHDVTELARILTGWTFNPRTGEFCFAARRHDQGTKNWLGHTIPEQGQREGEYALDVLASSPATARHIGFKLAQYFVADQPPPSLVAKLAASFTSTHGNIRAVLNVLFHSAEFWAPDNYHKKFKAPYQYMVSAVRATGFPVSNFLPLLGALNRLGMPLYGCQTPDGYKNIEVVWLNPDALTRRINFATALAMGRLPLLTPVEAGLGANDSTKSSFPLPQRLLDRAGISTGTIDAQALRNTLGNTWGPQTLATVAGAAPRVRPALLLGSPEFMYH